MYIYNIVSVWNTSLSIIKHFFFFRIMRNRFWCSNMHNIHSLLLIAAPESWSPSRRPKFLHDIRYHWWKWFSPSKCVVACNVDVSSFILFWEPIRLSLTVSIAAIPSTIDQVHFRCFSYRAALCCQNTFVDLKRPCRGGKNTCSMLLEILQQKFSTRLVTAPRMWWVVVLRCLGVENQHLFYRAFQHWKCWKWELDFETNTQWMNLY